MWYILLIFFIIGILLGSFYYYLSDRICNHKSIADGFFQCDNCNHKLSWYECIPIISYIFLRGKCKKCKIKISKDYIICELLTGLLFACSYYLYGFDYKTIILLILFSLLITIYITDFKYMIILNYPLIIGVIGILVTLFGNYNYLFVLQFILRGIVIMLLFLIVKLIGDRLFKQESLGWGDVKLAFFAGLLLGFKLSFIFIIVSILLALIYSLMNIIRNRKLMLPFGPFMITSLCIVYLFSAEISNIINLLLGV